jgi:hypothetical protein
MKKIFLILVLFCITTGIAKAQWFTNTGTNSATEAKTFYDQMSFNNGTGFQSVNATSTQLLGPITFAAGMAIDEDDIDPEADFYAGRGVFSMNATGTPPTACFNNGRVYVKGDNKIYAQVPPSCTEVEITGNTGTAADDAKCINNLGLNVTMVSGTGTIDITQKNGTSAPTGAQTVDICFRNASLTNGGYVIRSVTGATGTLDIARGATLGVASTSHELYAYAIDDVGTVRVAVSATYFPDESITLNTATMTATSASGSVMYADAEYSNVPFRLLGSFRGGQSDLGEWVSPASSTQLFKETEPQFCTISDKKASGTIGGQYTGAVPWDVRDLNDIGSNCFYVNSIQTFGQGNSACLIKGKYKVKVESPMAQAGNFMARLVTIVNSATSSVIYSHSNREDSGSGVNNIYAVVEDVIELTDDGCINVQNRAQITGGSGDFGNPVSFGVDETYTTIKLRKIR